MPSHQEPEADAQSRPNRKSLKKLQLTQAEAIVARCNRSFRSILAHASAWCGAVSGWGHYIQLRPIAMQPRVEKRQIP
jgi:hypothetical protein